MCGDVITLVVKGADGNVEITLQIPPDVNPSMLREARDQAVGTYRDALRVLTVEALAVEGATAEATP